MARFKSPTWRLTPEDFMSSANDVIEYTDFSGDLDLKTLTGQQPIAFKVISAGSGSLKIRTNKGDRQLTGLVAGDSMTIPFSHVLASTTNVAKLQVAFGAP